MNYERLWGRLSLELQAMTAGGDRAGAAAMIITYMCFMEEIEKLTAQAEARAKLLKGSADDHR